MAVVPAQKGGGGGEHGGDMAAVKRHVYGPRPIGALVPSVTRAAFRARSPASAQLLADWAEIVGPALAAVTAPRRLTAGTLTLACAGPVALELQHLAGPLLDRINGHLGRSLVSGLRFVQDAAAATPATPVRPRRPGKPVEVAGVPDGPLRDALAALGAAVAGDGA